MKVTTKLQTVEMWQYFCMMKIKDCVKGPYWDFLRQSFLYVIVINDYI